MAYTDLGNTIGRIYAVLNGIIQTSVDNTKQGIRSMKSLALQSRALGLGQRGFFTITISDITDAGSVTGVTIDTVAQIGASINYDTGEENDLAAAIALAISSFTPAGGPNYVAKSVGNVVYGYAPVGTDPSVNGDVVAVSTSGDITIATTNVSNIPDQTEIYSTTHGYRFYLNANVGAPIASYAAAEEVTKYIVPQTLDGQLPTKSVTLANDIATIERTGAITTVFLTPQSTDADDCIGINPAGFADGDFVYIQAVDSDKTITFKQSGIGNLQLKGGADYVSTSNVGQAILLRQHEGVFYEVLRAEASQSGNSGFNVVTNAQARVLRDTGGVVPGDTYFITDIVDRGLIVQGISTHRFAATGQMFAAVLDYAVGGVMKGTWISSLSVSENDICIYDTRHYINTTGVNTSTNPQSDTTNWQLLPFSSPTYRDETNFVLLRQNTSPTGPCLSCVQREDNKGNRVKGNIDGSFFRSAFPWGNSQVENCNLENSSLPLTKILWQSSTTGIEGLRMVNGSIEVSSNPVGFSISNTLIESVDLTLESTGDNAAVELRGCSFIGVVGVYGTQLSGVLQMPSSALNSFANIYYRAPIPFVINGGLLSEARNDLLIDLHTVDVYFSNELTPINLTGVLDTANNNTPKYLRLGDGNIVSQNLDVVDNEIQLEPGSVVSVISVDEGEEVRRFSWGSILVGRYRLWPKNDYIESDPVTVVGADIASAVDYDIVIPPEFWDDASPSGSPSDFAGSFTLEPSRGDYCEMRFQKLYRGGSGTPFYGVFVVEKVIKF